MANISAAFPLHESCRILTRLVLHFEARVKGSVAVHNFTEMIDFKRNVIAEMPIKKPFTPRLEKKCRRL